MKQRQFLDVIEESEAKHRFEAATRALQARSEIVHPKHALDRVLAEDLRAPIDVPGFDRSNMDGFAVRAADTAGADELSPVYLELETASLAAGVAPATDFELEAGRAMSIATGGVIPRGADAVVMIEDTSVAGGKLRVERALAPGANLTAAGTDLGLGEIVIRRGTRLSSRETGLAAAVGADQLCVIAKPRVAVLSTGDEVRPLGEPLSVGEIYDSNGRILCDAVTEMGGTPIECGILPDDRARIREELKALIEGQQPVDMLLLSGGTSKGAGDLNAEVLAELAGEHADSPGIVVHGVALKPGKPLCLAVIGKVPIAILPGFPTSAIFTFHEFLAPLLRRLGGRPEAERGNLEATVPLRIASAPGRTEYCLVDLVPGPKGMAAYPLGSGSGSVSTFSRADGFVRIDRHTEYIPAGSAVQVHPLSDRIRPADLVTIGSHCVGLDWLGSELSARGFSVKSVHVGSRGGLAALARGEGHLAGTHLLDGATGIYNQSFLPPGVQILRGYGRRQGFVFRPGDVRFEGKSLGELKAAVHANGVRMVNRNPGSGTRVLIDAFLNVSRGEEPAGYGATASSHHAVAAAVAQGRADWGLTLDSLAEASGLEFQFLQAERYDLVCRESEMELPAIQALLALFDEKTTGEALSALGLIVDESH